MRWSIVRLIWVRELRDQLRDRRTIFMVAVLPILLYPVAGYGMLQMAGAFLNQQSTVVVQGADNLPSLTAHSTGLMPPPAVAWFICTPVLDGGALAGAERLAAAASLVHRNESEQDYPPLFLNEENGTRVVPIFQGSPLEAKNLTFSFKKLTLLPEKATSVQPSGPDGTARAFRERIDRGPLERREADLLVVIRPGFRTQLEATGVPQIYVVGRENDERSKQAKDRVQNVLNRWKNRLKETRLARQHLPATYDDLFEVSDPQDDKPPREQAANELFDLLAKILPVILIMWSLAGALYPAIDVCAGEKERGTMETLLISPASREEIVWGKFLTIWVFSALTALLNLVSMGLTTWMLMPKEIPQGDFRTPALFWGVVLLLPVSAFFSAVCLAIGAYARSSKEGQYYLMPLFMVTMPLIFLTLAPDVVLNPFWSMVPVTGIALLLQTLISPGKHNEGAVWYYFIPVLLPMLFYSWLALRWAIEQFKREEVLFREAERLDIGLWLKRLFREKELLPSAGEAVFCFVVILLLNRLTLSFGEQLPLLVQTGIRYLAFMAAPPLFMALLLTRRPRQGLALRWPPRWAWPAAVVLAVLLFLPCFEWTRFMLDSVPTLKSQVDAYVRSVTPGPGSVLGIDPADPLQRWLAFLIFVVVGAVSEELAFRGFILTGLRQRFRPATAVLLSSFLFALAQMNVFQFVPHFVLGAVLGFLVLRSGSLWPGVVFHLLYNLLLLGPGLLPDQFDHLRYADPEFLDNFLLRQGLAAGSLLLAGVVLYAVARWTRPPAPLATAEPPAAELATAHAIIR